TRTLSHQYGGDHATGWLAYLPPTWLPYVQLARLSPPAGLFLIYFPHSFGILHGALLTHTPPLALLRNSLLLLGGSFFVSNAIHIWNDLIDAPLDALVERTRKRPIPPGAVSKNAALVFTFTQTLVAGLFLPCVLSFDRMGGEIAVCTAEYRGMDILSLGEAA
ncbi:4-hydroxybenzoate polyprenyltransferase, partial [Lachnellula suecica]